MRRAFQWILIGLAALVVVAGLVVAYVAATFDPNDYKDRIVEAVQKKTGRTLTMDVVDISYSLLAAGVSGFDATMSFKPKIGDGVDPHTDVNNDNFPFLGAPR